MCGKEQAAKLGMVPLLARTVSRRVDELAQNIKEQLIVAIKKSVHFAIQLDETTDVGSDPQLMVYVRYRGDAGSEKKCYSAARWILQPVESTFSKIVDEFFYIAR